MRCKGEGRGESEMQGRGEGRDEMQARNTVTNTQRLFYFGLVKTVLANTLMDSENYSCPGGSLHTTHHQLGSQSERLPPLLKRVMCTCSLFVKLLLWDFVFANFVLKVAFMKIKRNYLNNGV